MNNIATDESVYICYELDIELTCVFNSVLDVCSYYQLYILD